MSAQRPEWQSPASPLAATARRRPALCATQARRAALIFLLCYVAAIADLSLYPFTFTRPPTGLFWFSMMPPFFRRMALDGFLNVGLYLPLGASAMLVFSRSRLGL